MTVRPGAGRPLIELNGVTARYGAVVALDRISLRVEAHQIVALLGANGAGKTTTMRVISGLVRPSAGTVLIDGTLDVAKCSTQQVVRAGIAHVPEGREMFPDLSVDEALDIGAIARRDRAVQEDKDRLLARFPILKERRHQLAGMLSGGEQQMLAIARALMSRPRALLLDEPSLGLAPRMITTILEIVQRLNAEDGVAVLLVEQDVPLALEIASYGYVLVAGELRFEGRTSELSNRQEIQQAYLGAVR